MNFIVFDKFLKHQIYWSILLQFHSKLLILINNYFKYKSLNVINTDKFGDCKE